MQEYSLPYGSEDAGNCSTTNFNGDFYRAEDTVTRGVSLPAPGPDGRRMEACLGPELPQHGPAYGTEKAEGGSSGGFSGDYYRAMDNVTRGVSLAMPTLGSDAGHLKACGASGNFGGDFYLAEDVTRGVSLPGYGQGDFYSKFDEPDMALAGEANSMKYMGGMDKGLYSVEHIFDDMPIPSLTDARRGLPTGMGGLGGMDHQAVSKHLPFDDVPCFGGLHQPPALSPDPLFRLEDTTMRIHLHDRGPHDLGNDVLEFLKWSVRCYILKVAVEKYSIKVNVFADEHMCTMKVRMFAEGNNVYVVELHRRSGDPVCFNTTYQHALTFFKNKGYSFPVAEKAPAQAQAGEALFRPPAMPADVAAAAGDTLGSEIGPLLDMAGYAEQPGLQAEAATALAGVARDTTVATSLCSDFAIKQLQQLLQSDELNIAYPTARLLSELASRRQTAHCFENDDLLSRMIKKVCSEATDGFVKAELAEVVKAAVSQCAAKLTAEARAIIAEALNDAVKEAGPCVRVQRNLVEARNVLKIGNTGAPSWS